MDDFCYHLINGCCNKNSQKKEGNLKVVRKLFKLPLILLLTLFLTGCQSIPTDRPAQIGDIVIVIGNVITLLAPFALIAFFAMLIYGGFQLMMSGGDPKAAGAARNTLTYAILGIILVVVVWLLLLLIENITGVNVTTVEIPDISP
jgi:hypothetical protein